MLQNKNGALEAFKVFKAQVDKQSEKQIKIMKIDIGGEYCDRYTKDGQVQGPLGNFLQQNVSVAQFIMHGSPNQSSVAEMRN